ncbi:ORM1-like protein 2 [Xenia sp. Carnegie-2017]|uniref:ORM1-like protein 2 n=1 Tax=Xenia sp. Carnegie-2017 TaxID=2897299 RepID=UPI001F04CAF8|nr:ORM1-like protein 2 [Xenia sp. Carnegie-2017]
MAEKAPHSRFNPNESWLEGRGSWLTYAVVVCITHLAILSIPFIGTATAWTLTSIIHCIATYYFLHYLKGNPFENSVDGGSQGKDRRLTHWEQINQGTQNTSTKKFMTLVPVVIFILASFYTKYDAVHFLFNSVALASALIPKLPQLHKVRVFGFNRY